MTNTMPDREDYVLKDGEFYYCKPESTSWCDILKNNVPLDRLCHEQILSDEMREPNHYETEREKWAVLNARFLPDIPYEAAHGIDFKDDLEYGDTIPDLLYEETKKEVIIPKKSNKNHDEKEKSKNTKSKKNKHSFDIKKDLVKKILEKKDKRRIRSLRDRNERDDKINNQHIEDCDPSEYFNDINSNDYLNKRVPKRKPKINKFTSWRKRVSLLEYYSGYLDGDSYSDCDHSGWKEIDYDYSYDNDYISSDYDSDIEE